MNDEHVMQEINKNPGKHLFKPGFSGNPAGRKKNVRLTSTILREQIADAIPDIIATLLEQAKGGDVAAAKLLLERAIAPLRPEALPTPLPELQNASSLHDLLTGLVKSMAAGEIAISDGAILMSAIARLKGGPPAPPEMTIEELDAKLNNILPGFVEFMERGSFAGGAGRS